MSEEITTWRSVATSGQPKLSTSPPDRYLTPQQKRRLSGETPSGRVIISPTGIRWEVFDKEGFAVYLGQQRTEEWHRVRAGRITASNADSALGTTSKVYREKFLEKLGLPHYKQHVTPAMQHGLDQESNVKRWYEQKYAVTVRDVGFAYPLDSPRLGVSVDGLVGAEGMTEVKCPAKGIYPKLKERLEAIRLGKIDLGIPTDYSHITPSHYAQMQLGMAIMKRKWCDYIVADIPSENAKHKYEPKYYVERVYYNHQYWLLSKRALEDFAEAHLEDTPIETIQGTQYNLTAEKLAEERSAEEIIAFLDQHHRH